jgi:hypothetical protein
VSRAAVYRAAVLLGVAVLALGSVYAWVRHGSEWHADPASTLPRATPEQQPRRAVTAQDLCVTLGRLRAPTAAAEPLGVDSAQFRATLAGSGGQSVALGFRFLGPSADAVALASGEQRAQLGLKLLARDTCNLLYVMWRSTPKSELVVSLKSNPEHTRHAECGSHGYTRLRPERALPVPSLEPGSVHELEASVSEGTLQVHVDQELVWQARLSGAALSLRGASGLRSDNVRFDVLGLSVDPDRRQQGSSRCASTEKSAAQD